MMNTTGAAVNAPHPEQPVPRKNSRKKIAGPHPKVHLINKPPSSSPARSRWGVRLPCRIVDVMPGAAGRGGGGGVRSERTDQASSRASTRAICVDGVLVLTVAPLLPQVTFEPKHAPRGPSGNARRY